MVSRWTSVCPSIGCLSEPTFQVKGFNFVTTLCFIPLRYIINIWVRELIALKTLWKFIIPPTYEVCGGI